MNAPAKDSPDKIYHFLQGGGEMGALTRAFDWSNTAVGIPDKWPQSLRTMVSMVLSSKFPMFLWWGKDLVQFYNDAYRPSLGHNGKHPAALGQEGKECWPEIWEVIDPLIRKVLNTGEATWSEDQLIPIYRNGNLEDVYWTFCYSPVKNEQGAIDGVLVTCTETTDKVKAIEKLEDSNVQLEFAIDAAELGTWDLNPFTNKFTGNDRLKNWFGLPPESEIELPLALAAIAEKDRQHVSEVIQEALNFSSGGKYDIIYTIVNPLTKEERIVRARGKASFNADKIVYRFNGTLQDITEESLAKSAIEESEERFRTMAEGTEVMIAVGDETSNAVYFNNAWTELTGRPAQDLLKFGWADLVHPEDREAYVTVYLNAFAEKNPFTGEFRVLNNQGDYRWLLAKGLPRFRPDGSFAGYISSCIDITEQKLSLQSMKENAQKLSSVVDSAPFPIGVYAGREMRIELANQSILNIWGKGNDVIGKLYTDILPELKDQKIFEQLDEVYTSGKPLHMKNQYLDLVVNGKMQPYYFNYSFTPLYDASGKVYGVMNTAADVTEQNIAQKKVQESERNLRNMILQAPVAICIFRGQDFVIEIANNSMFEFWGKSGEAVLNKPLFEAIPEAVNQGYEELMREVLNTGKGFSASEQPITLPRNGIVQNVFINFAYEPIFESDGSISGIMAVATDVTPQVQARQKIEEVVADRTNELAHANKHLKRSNAELEQFAYIASHDLQEPLRKISTFTQMLESSLSTVDDRSKNYLDKVNKASQRMTKLISDVLSYSQLSKGGDVFKEVDLQGLVEDIESDFELLIEEKQATINCQSLPGIEAIPMQMSQLFGNLVSNALKFSRPDVNPVITITAKLLSDKEARKVMPGASSSYYHIEFSDNGIGFKEEYAEQIFNIFQRLHGKTEYAGTGIGLALCKKIVQNHHGDIYAAPNPGGGASFHVILPAKQADKKEA